MIRDSLAPDAPHAFMAITPANGAAFQRRAAGGESSAHIGTSGLAPIWVKLVRQGGAFAGYISTDGVNSNLVGSESIALSSTVQVGLAVTSHDNNAATTAVFSDISISSP